MNTARLDDQELLHLALRASDQNRHEEAISYLKRALDISPDNAKAHYMLGAEHAEIGLYDRAAEEMAKAVKLDPTLVTAQFQLGLLHITSARVKEAEETWKPLDKLGPNNPFYLFKTGMLHLARDEFDACIETLEKGIKLNQQNAALNNDMRRVIDDVKAKFPPGAGTGTPAAAPEDKDKTKYPRDVSLTAYRQSPDEKE
jgi:tetratricopeptide (TPR) repeat protein